MITGFWAFTKTITNIRRILIGNRYQSHCQSVSLNILNAAVILSPISQTTNITTSDQKIRNKNVINSNGFKTPSNWNKNVKIKVIFGYNKSLFCAKKRAEKQLKKINTNVRIFMEWIHKMRIQLLVLTAVPQRRTFF